MGALTVRAMQILELEDEPQTAQIRDLPEQWQDAVRELTDTGAQPDTPWVDCEDCGTQVPTPVGLRWVSDGWRPRDGWYAWHPAIGVLEDGKVRWLCPDCGHTPEPVAGAR